MIGILEKGNSWQHSDLLTEEKQTIRPTILGVMSPGGRFSHWFFPSALAVYTSQ